MSFTKTFPYSTGTFMVVENSWKKERNGLIGVIACYQCVAEDEEDDMTVMLSGYRESWCGECLLSELRLATEEEVKEYLIKRGIKEGYTKEVDIKTNKEIILIK